MEGCRCSLHSSALTLLPSSVSRNGLPEKPFVNGQVLKFPSSKKAPTATKFRFLNIRAQASGTSKFSSETAESIPKESSKDENLAFVAGATGRVGSRAVRELLKLGFRVRAGVRSTDRAKTLVQSVKQLKLDTESAGGESQPVEKLEIVQCDLEKKEQIGSALGKASVVLCCIGASEKQSFDISGPYRIDYLATKNLIEAATVAKVDHFILLTSLGTNKIGFPAAILNLFWGVLIWKRKAEEALLASGIPYTIVRPGGMERPTDAFKETHNITLSQEDTLFGGLVSNLQVAELIACMAKNRDLSYCKVVEVIAKTTAPLTPMEELLKKIPSQRPIVSSPKESSAAKAPDLAPPQSEEQEKTTARPLSPYTAYEDLKPPISPSPSPSTSVGSTKASGSVSKATIQEGIKETEVKKTSYEDLKPPTSPSPTPSGLKKPPSDVSTAEEAPPPSSGSGNEAANIVIDGVSKNGPPQISTQYHSPYPVYDDFKPPTSPSPSAPTVKPPSPPLTTESTSSTECTSSTESSAQQDPTKPAPRPLSPFTMYEDLKPPASPSPSAPYISK